MTSAHNKIGNQYFASFFNVTNLQRTTEFATCAIQITQKK